MISTALTQRHVFRFNALGSMSSGVPVTIDGIIGAAGCTGIGTNQVTCWWSQFKINKISMWGAPSVSSGVANAATVTVEYRGNTVFPSGKEISDTSYSTDKGPHVVAIPPKLSSAGMWQDVLNTTTGTLAVLTATNLAIVDLDVTLRNPGANSLTINCSAATLAVNYWLYLDGPVTAVLKPVALTTTL